MSTPFPYNFGSDALGGFPLATNPSVVCQGYARLNPPTGHDPAIDPATSKNRSLAPALSRFFPPLVHGSHHGLPHQRFLTRPPSPFQRRSSDFLVAPVPAFSCPWSLRSLGRGVGLNCVRSARTPDRGRRPGANTYIYVGFVNRICRARYLAGQSQPASLPSPHL